MQLFNGAARIVQKHLKGYLIRKHFKLLSKQYYFFKQAERKYIIKDIV
jgi:hypothetical protein